MRRASFSWWVPLERGPWYRRGRARRYGTKVSLTLLLRRDELLHHGLREERRRQHSLGDHEVVECLRVEARAQRDLHLRAQRAQLLQPVEVRGGLARRPEGVAVHLLLREGLGHAHVFHEHLLRALW